MRGVNLLINVSLKLPENGNENCAHHKDEKIQGYAEPKIIGKAIPAGPVHHEIRLVPDGGCKKHALAPKQAAIMNGLGLTPSVAAVEMAMGIRRTAVALLLRIWVLILANRSMPINTTCGPKL